MTATSLDARIVSTPEIMGGEPRLEGRRIRVKDIVMRWEQQAKFVEELKAKSPSKLPKTKEKLMW